MSDDEKPAPQEPSPGAHVVSLESRIRAGAKPRLSVAREAFCIAHHFEMDRETRLVQCTKCKASFEAFEAMVYLAEHWVDFNGNREAICRDLDDLKKQRDELKADVARLKSTVRRRLQAVAEASPHATRALELLLRIRRDTSRTPYSSDRVALSALLEKVESEAKIVGIHKPAVSTPTPGRSREPGPT